MIRLAGGNWQYIKLIDKGASRQRMEGWTRDYRKNEGKSGKLKNFK